jgi:hypothetical protein
MTERLDHEKPEKGNQSAKGKGKGRKLGRNKNKCAQYRAMHTREKNKIKRVLQSNGVKFAEAWAAKHGVVTLLHTLKLKKVQA